MYEKRRDSKNRILRIGESQRKDGRYVFKYVDALGKQRFIYAWKLVPTDKTPAGKREDLSLREKVQDIHKDIEDGIDPIGKKITVCQLYQKHNRYNGNVRMNTTITGRSHLMQLLQKDPLGSTSIDRVKVSDAKEWALRMKEQGYAFSTISNYKRALRAAFYIAVQDDCIRKNPFDFEISAVLENDTAPKTPLDAIQQESLLAFVKADKTYRAYYDEIIILLETGLRISELCALTVADIDFDRGFIQVDHQLLSLPNVGYKIEPPKTKNSIRKIPITRTARAAFKRVMSKGITPTITEIDGYKNFVFLNRLGRPKYSTNYQDMFKRLAHKHNKQSDIQLPEVFTPHVLRHTFCTNMANSGMNPKALQYIMGHSNINMTLNYYTHVTHDSAKAEMERLGFL